MAGITLDTSADLGTVTGTSLTVSYTVTGSNTALFVGGIIDKASDPSMTITYNAVPLIKLGFLSGSQSPFLWWLPAAATGAHNIVISWTGSQTIFAGAVSYTGASQIAVIDSTTTNGFTSTGTLTTPTTTIVDKSWLVMIGRTESGSTFMTAGTNTTLRRQIGANTSIALFDSNGAQTPAGSYSLQTTQPAGLTGHVIASFAPLFITQTDTVSTTDSDIVIQNQFITQTDTVSTSDTDKVKYGFNNTSKSSSTWTNQAKS